MFKTLRFVERVLSQSALKNAKNRIQQVGTTNRTV